MSIPSHMRFCVPFAALAAAAALLASAAVAQADSSLSQNWAGYAAHGADFQRVSARWRQPQAICTRGHVRYSAMWVGLGGYSTSAQALEQVGTELDCSSQGHVASSAWYEFVPSPSHTIALPVRPGDRIAASVSVSGDAVTVMIANLTRNRSFRRTVAVADLDISSADWILEAPSACFAGTSDCNTLPLTNFRHAAFIAARAERVGGPLGTISNPDWAHTRIILAPGGPLFSSDRSGTTAVATARPSALTDGGSSFRIFYQRRYVPTSTVLAPALRGRTYLRH